MRINKSTYLVLALLLTSVLGKAQSTAFSMSPIFMSSASTTTIGGHAVQAEGGTSCYTVATGLRTLTISMNAAGSKFAEGCTEKPPVAQLLTLTSLKVFPSPVHTLTTLKCEGNFDANLSCQVKVISIDGRILMNKMVAMKEILAGYPIDASSYAAGTYVVTVAFMNEQHSVKFIKI